MKYMSHTHSIIDSDKHFTIDPVSRLINNASDKLKLIQNDHNKLNKEICNNR